MLWTTDTIPVVRRPDDTQHLSNLWVLSPLKISVKRARNIYVLANTPLRKQFADAFKRIKTSTENSKYKLKSELDLVNINSSLYLISCFIP